MWVDVRLKRDNVVKTLAELESTEHIHGLFLRCWGEEGNRQS